MPLSYRSVFLRNSVKALKMYKSNSCLAEQRAESALNQHAQLWDATQASTTPPRTNEANPAAET